MNIHKAVVIQQPLVYRLPQFNFIAFGHAPAKFSVGIAFRFSAPDTALFSDSAVRTGCPRGKLIIKGLSEGAKSGHPVEKGEHRLAGLGRLFSLTHGN